jgi:hypothetical protein
MLTAQIYTVNKIGCCATKEAMSTAIGSKSANVDVLSDFAAKHRVNKVVRDRANLGI